MDFRINSLLPLMAAVVLAALFPLAAVAVTFDVSSSGDDMGLSEALELAEPGDTIFLADGTYDSAIVSYRGGEDGQPITVEGGPDAVINGNYKSRSVLINHSFISLRGFSVDGKVGDGSDSEDYINKCVYVDGEDSELDGFVMEGLFVQNCGGECVRLKNGVVNATILENTIENCGVHDTQFESEGKNGEGIYIGTSSNQWVDDETPDNCVGNLIEGNIITNGIECVDIKEGSTKNIVQGNLCSDQIDELSGCFNIRGDNNIIRRDDFWRTVYDNDFVGCGQGSVTVVTESQGSICGNICDEGNCDPFGAELGDIKDTWDQACDGNADDDDDNVDDTVDGSDDDDDGGSDDDDEEDDDDDDYDDDDDDDADDDDDDDEEDDDNDGSDDAVVDDGDDDDDGTGRLLRAKGHKVLLRDDKSRDSFV